VILKGGEDVGEERTVRHVQEIVSLCESVLHAPVDHLVVEEAFLDGLDDAQSFRNRFMACKHLHNTL